MQDKLIVGLIVKPQGVRGELKVQPLTDDIKRFKKLSKIYIDDKIYRVNGVRLTPDTAFVVLSGVCDRNQAEFFRNKYIYVDRQDAIIPKNGSYFIVDIIGSKVIFEDESVLGTVQDVFSSRTDIFTVITENGKKVRFPFLKDLVVKVDIENSILILNKKRFGEVSCYEN